VRAAAARLRYRDLVIVAVMLERERATDQTWIYFPGKDIPFGRLHEPTNWSAAMAPPGRTLLVTECFCFRGDATWNASDAELIETTVHHLEKLGFIRQHEVCDGMVVRIPAAYPLFEVGYQERSRILSDYLERFENLQVAGRGGLFRYYNMDQAIASGLAAAEALLGRDTEMRATVAVEGAS
jgi:protoporphyrinogen oxidase